MSIAFCNPEEYLNYECFYQYQVSSLTSYSISKNRISTLPIFLCMVRLPVAVSDIAVWKIVKYQNCVLVQSEWFRLACQNHCTTLLLWLIRFTLKLSWQQWEGKPMRLAPVNQDVRSMLRLHLYPARKNQSHNHPHHSIRFTEGLKVNPLSKKPNLLVWHHHVVFSHSLVWNDLHHALSTADLNQPVCTGWACSYLLCHISSPIYYAGVLRHTLIGLMRLNGPKSLTLLNFWVRHK